MNKEIKYELTFEEVLNDLFKNNNWYQGEDFKDGVFMCIEDEMLKIKEFSKNQSTAKDLGSMITKGMYEQKYRKVTTQPDIMRTI